MKNLINQSYNQILEDIKITCFKNKRDPKSVNVIAICKRQPLQKITKAIDSGINNFGENRVQDGISRWSKIKSKKIILSFVGPLQTNKTRVAMEIADSIHTLDRLKLAKNIARIAQEIGKCPELFVQVNTGEEPQKSGIFPRDTQTFIKECLSMNLPIIGLMCIPPINEEASLHFSLLRNIAEDCGLDGPMGMSSDFEKAISFGATHIRVGSAIFGERVNSQGQ